MKKKFFGNAHARERNNHRKSPCIAGNPNYGMWKIFIVGILWRQGMCTLPRRLQDDSDAINASKRALKQSIEENKRQK